MSAFQTERVKVVVGHPKDPDQDMIPVVVHDLESRRLKFQYAPRDQLAVMLGDDMGDWTAIWMKSLDRWVLIDYLGDMRKGIKAVEAA